MTFGYKGYDLKFIQKQPCKDESAHLFTLIFKFYSPVTRYLYILHADYHQQDVFAIKFYCKKDRRSDYKYSKVTNKGDAGNILITCLKVVPLLLKSYPTASFAFAAAVAIDIDNRRAEPYRNNQRFRIYRYLIASKFGSQTFAHFEYSTVSIYLLINRQCNVLLKEKAIMKTFEETYENIENL